MYWDRSSGVGRQIEISFSQKEQKLSGTTFWRWTIVRCTVCHPSVSSPRVSYRCERPARAPSLDITLDTTWLSRSPSFSPTTGHKCFSSYNFRHVFCDHHPLTSPCPPVPDNTTNYNHHRSRLASAGKSPEKRSWRKEEENCRFLMWFSVVPWVPTFSSRGSRDRGDVTMPPSSLQPRWWFLTLILTSWWSLSSEAWRSSAWIQLWKTLRCKLKLSPVNLSLQREEEPTLPAKPQFCQQSHPQCHQAERRKTWRTKMTLSCPPSRTS